MVVVGAAQLSRAPNEEARGAVVCSTMTGTPRRRPCSPGLSTDAAERVDHALGASRVDADQRGPRWPTLWHIDQLWMDLDIRVSAGRRHVRMEPPQGVEPWTYALRVEPKPSTWITRNASAQVRGMINLSWMPMDPSGWGLVAHKLAHRHSHRTDRVQMPTRRCRHSTRRPPTDLAWIHRLVRSSAGREARMPCCARRRCPVR